jgi:AcrR family transcriptional regulator
MSPRPRTDERQPNLQEAIKDTAWKQITESGAASLSLRAIARELGITAPAIYNYYPSRDDLVTALIVDAFTSLAEAQEASLAGLAQNRRAVRLSALGLAYREWAVTYPQRYHLIFGTPIPNYTAPEEVTQPAATKALVPLIQSIQDLASAGELRTERLAEMSPKLKSMLGAWSEFAGGFNQEVLYLALVIWSRVHGLVMLEITHQIPSFFDNPEEVYRQEIKNLLIQYL